MGCDLEHGLVTFRAGRCLVGAQSRIAQTGRRQGGCQGGVAWIGRLGSRALYDALRGSCARGGTDVGTSDNIAGA